MNGKAAGIFPETGSTCAEKATALSEHPMDNAFLASLANVLGYLLIPFSLVFYFFDLFQLFGIPGLPF